MGADPMLLIAVTPHDPVDNEWHKVEALLQSGWHRVHLRHPDSTLADMRRIIERIDQKYHNRIVLHGHFDLINDFNLGGLHLNHRCPSAPSLYHGPLSRSCHSLQEIHDAEGLEYVTLSPIFDSISKQGYRSAFNHEDLTKLSHASVPLIALGGISPDNIAEIRQYNFAGFAMLGAIPWHGTVEDVNKFAKQALSIC
ncbi:thiamine phosphate synthase [uncultured Duncaniella sp.]|uniref:thiamine phosphate synthase n=1 Tax=uncultured Duncaniella sp. TaxID=2768039 RepID=UPI0025AA029E|nr:thiamine phosphate synthase [uncultured Duncaniella sp.]